MIQGKAIVFGDNIDTDQIIGAHHLSLPSIADMAPFTFEHYSHFGTGFTHGDILVGGENFGCGSSREQAPAVLKERGVAAIVGKSFARIFFRNAINLGLPVIVCPLIQEIGNFTPLEIKDKSLRDLGTGREFLIEEYPPFIQSLVEDGGIIAHIRNKRQKAQGDGLLEKPILPAR
jgi:3-isopropylmalate/(R)-2-methylmalate dehydratase small subunit